MSDALWEEERLIVEAAALPTLSPEFQARVLRAGTEAHAWTVRCERAMAAAAVIAICLMVVAPRAWRAPSSSPRERGEPAELARDPSRRGNAGLQFPGAEEWRAVEHQAWERADQARTLHESFSG